MRTSIAAIAVGVGLCLGLTGCATKVQYRDPGAVETVNTDFGSTDLQMIAEKMVDSLIAEPEIGAKPGSPAPVCYVALFKNKTDEHVDMQNITDKIRTALIRSRKFRFTAATEMNDELVKQLEYQVSSGLVRPDTAKQFGQQIGADYFLYGELTNIRKQGGRVEDVYMKFNMNLVNIQTGIIDWADEREIAKTAKRPVFGR